MESVWGESSAPGLTWNVTLTSIVSEGHRASSTVCSPTCYERNLQTTVVHDHQSINRDRRDRLDTTMKEADRWT